MKLEDATARDAYDLMADSWAAGVDERPYNAHYDRPAVRSLLPSVSGKRVLDAGCGSGAYSEWLVEQGAEVVGIDVSPRLIEHAQRRLGDRAAFTAGFRLERVLEPRPQPEFRRQEPRDYAKLMRQPGFMCIRAAKGMRTL